VDQPVSAVIGVDPGGITGLAVIVFARGTQQYDYAEPKYVGVYGEYTEPAELFEQVRFWAGAMPGIRLAAERFVVSRRAGRSATAGAGTTARNILGELTAFNRTGVPLSLRTASEVKKWATDKRLDAAGLLKPTIGKPHARDAARHALFSLVADLGCPDPLSSSYRSGDQT
jgi:hypothetical protein